MTLLDAETTACAMVGLSWWLLPLLAAWAGVCVGVLVTGLVLAPRIPPLPDPALDPLPPLPKE